MCIMLPPSKSNHENCLIHMGTDNSKTKKSALFVSGFILFCVFPVNIIVKPDLGVSPMPLQQYVLSMSFCFGADLLCLPSSLLSPLNLIPRNQSDYVSRDDEVRPGNDAIIKHRKDPRPPEVALVNVALTEKQPFQHVSFQNLLANCVSLFDDQLFKTCSCIVSTFSFFCFQY